MCDCKCDCCFHCNAPSFDRSLLDAKIAQEKRDVDAIAHIKLLPEQTDPIVINLNWFKRVKEAAFWKCVAVYLYAYNTLTAFIEWAKKSDNDTGPR